MGTCYMSGPGGSADTWVPVHSSLWPKKPRTLSLMAPPGYISTVRDDSRNPHCWDSAPGSTQAPGAAGWMVDAYVSGQFFTHKRHLVG